MRFGCHDATKSCPKPTAFMFAYGACYWRYDNHRSSCQHVQVSYLNDFNTILCCIWWLLKNNIILKRIFVTGILWVSFSTVSCLKSQGKFDDIHIGSSNGHHLSQWWHSLNILIRRFWWLIIQWRQNERNSASNYRRFERLLSRLFRRRSKDT